jgi:hypothetical protein
VAASLASLAVQVEQESAARPVVAVTLVLRHRATAVLLVAEERILSSAVFRFWWRVAVAVGLPHTRPRQLDLAEQLDCPLAQVWLVLERMVQTATTLVEPGRRLLADLVVELAVVAPEARTPLLQPKAEPLGATTDLPAAGLVWEQAEMVARMTPLTPPVVEVAVTPEAEAVQVPGSTTQAVVVVAVARVGSQEPRQFPQQMPPLDWSQLQE